MVRHFAEANLFVYEAMNKMITSAFKGQSGAALAGLPEYDASDLPLSLWIVTGASVQKGG